MDRRLYRCAVDGDLVALGELIREDELILEKVLEDSDDTPLHIAARRGHVAFAKYLLQLMPKFANTVDQKARSPLHLACARGDAEVAGEILGVDAGLCFLRDQNGRNPLHVAAIKGFIEVTEQILAINPRCMLEVTTPQGETILHLTVRNNRVGLLKYLLGRKDIGSLVNKADNDGKTIFHLASASENSEMVNAVQQLRQNAPEVGSSPVDMEAQRSAVSSSRVSNDDRPKKKVKQFEEQKENKLSEKRSAMMIVSVLIATLTYQAALNPPGGFLQEDKQRGSWLFDAGTAINAEKFTYHAFERANAVGLFTSLTTILLLTTVETIKHPLMMWGLMFNLWASIFSVAFSFVFGLYLIAGTGMIKTLAVFLLSCMALLAALLVWHTPKFVKETLGKMRKQMSCSEAV